MKFFWMLVNTAEPAFAGLKAQAEVHHKASHPDNELSVFFNNAGDEALIKVTEGDPAWSAGQGITPIRTFTEADHNEAQALMYTPEWERPQA